MSEERLRKYNVWVTELESRQQRLGASRRGYARFFVGSVFVSCFGFLWNAWVGVGALLTGVMFCVFGFYVIAVRGREYARELAQTREAVTAMRVGDRTRETAPDKPDVSFVA